MKKNLIVIGGGILQVPLIETALEMGLAPVVFDMSESAPGMQLAERRVLMSTRDIDGCVREARKLRELMPLHGAITAGTDASRSVAAIAGALELPGIRFADAEAASNKVLMRKRLRKHSVPVPDFASVWSVKEAREAMDELNFPLVIKPADNMGARGVIRVDRREDIYNAFRHARRYSPTGEMILEEYMHGPELSVDALAWEGRVRITGIADRIVEREPYFVEIGHNMPSSMPPDVLMEVEDIMRRGMEALGIHTGAAKGDIKVTAEGVRVGEIAARLSGGYMSSHTYPLHSGVNLLRAAIQICLGETPDRLEPTRNLVAIERGILASPGKILTFRNREAMQQVPGIHSVVFTRAPGDVIKEITSNIDKAGHIVAVAETLDKAEAAVAAAMERLELLVDSSFSVDWKQVEDRARSRFTDRVCWVCKVCDGLNCASGVPGMGGVGRMTTFQENSRALARLQIVPRYIREPVEPDLSVELFGRKFEMPIMGAPMTGAVTNLGGSVDELDFNRNLLLGCRDQGSIAWVGDGASPEKYLTIMEALSAAGGFGIAIFKPRSDPDALARRFEAAQEAGAIAVGMDVDAISFRTLQLKGQATRPRDAAGLRRIRDRTALPFVLKGIMSGQDAKAALDAGVDAIVVSNHGGRIMDDMPGTADVLASIVEAVGGRVPVLVDGGIRTGQDVLKMLALGAKAVLIGRPLAIASVGGGVPAVRFYLQRCASELRSAMQLCGAERCEDLDRGLLRPTGTPERDFFPGER